MPTSSNFFDNLTVVPPADIVEAVQNDKRPTGRGMVWTIRNEVLPSDLYCYLRAKFGPPNGLQNLFRKDDSDNLIHWEWVLNSDFGWLSFIGMSFRTELLFTGSFPFDESYKSTLTKIIKSDFRNYAKPMAIIRNSLEDWVEFANPYYRIKQSIDKLLNDLQKLELRPEEDGIPDLTNSAQAAQVEKEWQALYEKYSKANGLCFGIRSMLPVMAEAFVNLVFFALMRPDISSDTRLKDHITRQPIDIRIKTLHTNCVAFAQPVDYSHPACRAYHSLVNERNDLLHGNINLDKLKFNEIYFNGKTPIFKQYHSMWHRTVGIEAEAVGLRRLNKEIETVNNLVSYIASCMTQTMQEKFERIAATRDLGLNQKTGRLGVLFPNHLVDFVAVFEGSEPHQHASSTNNPSNTTHT